MSDPSPAAADAPLNLSGAARAAELRDALGTVGLDGITVQAGEPKLCVQLMTPRRRVKLQSRS